MPVATSLRPLLDKLGKGRLLGRSWFKALALVLLATFLVSLMERVWFFADIIANLRAYLAVAFLGLSLWFGWRREWKWLGVAGSGLFITGGLVLSHLTLTAPRASAEEAGVALRVFTFNANYGSQNHQEVLELIEELDPDVIILLEVTAAWREPLKALEPKYGYDLFEFRPDPFGIAFLSRVKVKKSQLFSPAGYELLAVEAQLEVDGRDVMLYGAHPPPPAGGLQFRVRNWYLDDLAKRISYVRYPVLVAGDFNMAPGSAAYSNFLETTQLKNAGKPCIPTWSMFRTPLFGLRLDYQLVSEHWRVKEAKVGDFLQSDHRWLVSDLVLAE